MEVKVLNRRDFIKSAAATLLFGGLSAGELSAESIESKKYLGKALQEVWEMTTLHKKVQPESAIFERLLGIPSHEKGEMPLVRRELSGSKKMLTKTPKTLTYFGQVTDVHIVDEESPARLVAAEKYLKLIGIDSAFHPQEDLTLHVLDSMIRTFNTIMTQRKLDFLLNTGDSIDNAGENELQNFIKVFAGGTIDPDSGTNQDPRPGAANDANDPFIAPGFTKNIPVYATIGNHDILLQGNIPPTLRGIYNSIVKKFLKFMELRDPVGNYSNAVLTPWLTPPNINNLKAGLIIPDAGRKPLTGKDFIKLYLENQKNRVFMGFPEKVLGSEYGYYSVMPKSGLPLRLVALDTTLRLGSAKGAIDATQYKEFLIPELEKAKKNKELVIITSHHPGNDIMTLASIKAELKATFGKNKELNNLLNELFHEMSARKDAYISRNTFEDTLKSYPNVIAHIAGHQHQNKITKIGQKGHGYWEVQTASLLGFPQQSRLFEVVYEGSGVGSIQTCVVDHDSPQGSFADYSRKLAYEDHKKSKNRKDFPGNPTGQARDRNAILQFSIPPEIEKKL